jgi:hypothetical protein
MCGVLDLNPLDQLRHVDQLADPLTNNGHWLDLDQVAVVSWLSYQLGSEADELVIPADLPPSRRRPVSLAWVVEGRQAIGLRHQAEPTRRPTSRQRAG